MAASWLEGDGDGLELNPNFELLAILLALALQEGDVERFLEVYDNNVPRSLSAVEVEGLKDRARELSDLPGGCLLELKVAQEREVVSLSVSSEISLGCSFSRRVCDGHQLFTDEAGHGDPCRGSCPFQSKFGALLNQRLKASSRTDGGRGDASENLGALNLQENHSNVHIGSQAGISWVCQQEAATPPLDQQAFFETDCDLLAAGDRQSNITQIQWNTMERTTAHNKVHRLQTGKKAAIYKTPTVCLQEQVCMNGSVDVNIRTSNCTEEETHGIKSKPPQKESLHSESSKTLPKSANQSSHPENVYTDNCMHRADCNDDGITAFITKTSTVPDSPPFKSLEEVGHSIGELLEKSRPKNLMYLTKVTTRLVPSKSVGYSMGSKAGAKYGTIPYVETSPMNKDGLYEVDLTRSGTHLNHQLPINTPEDLKNTKSKSFSTPKVPSNMNLLTVNVSPDEQDKDFDGEEQPKDISSSQLAAAKKKKKKNKKKKAGTGFEAVNTNNIKLHVPVGLPSDHHTKDSCSTGTTASKLTNQSSSDFTRHPPPMVSSDSVTSSGESSTDGAACGSDTGCHQHTSSAKKNPSPNYVSCSSKNTSVNSVDSAITGSGAGQDVLTSSKLHHTQEILSTDLEHGGASVETYWRTKIGIQRQNPPISKPSRQKLSQAHSVRSDPSDSDSDRNETKTLVERDISWQTTAAGKPHSLSEPTASADSSVDKDDSSDFIKVESKRSQRNAKKRSGVIDNHKYGLYSGRYIDRDREYFRNRNMLSAGLRKSSSEPSGMSELGDKDNVDVHNYKTKPKTLSDNLGKLDSNLAISGHTEPSTTPQSDFSYASKVKCNMKTSSLPPKLTPQVLLDYVDDNYSDNPDNSETSPEFASDSKFPAFECKPRLSGKSVLHVAKNDTVVVEKGETNISLTGKEQPVKNNIKAEKFVSLTSKPSDSGGRLGPRRSFQRSSSMDTSEVTKKVSFNDDLIRSSPPPRQGLEPSVQYLFSTYADSLKVHPPKPLAMSPQLASDAPKASSVVGPRDHTLQPLFKQNEKEGLSTSRASIVLAKIRPNNVVGDGCLPTKPDTANPVSVGGFKPVDQPTQTRIVPTAWPTSLSRNSVVSPTPSASSSTSKPHPTFDLEPQDNFDITFGSVIVGKAGYEIIAEDTASGEKCTSPIKELLSKVQMRDQLPSPPGLSCAELEKTFMNKEPSQTTPKSTGRKSPIPGNTGVRRVTLGLATSTKDDDGIWDFNHVELAEMLLSEWHKTQAEIGQKKVLVEG